MIKSATLWFLLLSGIGSPVWAQDWTAVRSIPAGAPVRVFTSAGRVDGRVAQFDDEYVRIVSEGTLVPIARHDVIRLETKRRDPLWNGTLAGALAALALRVAFGGEACSRTP